MCWSSPFGFIKHRISILTTNKKTINLVDSKQFFMFCVNKNGFVGLGTLQYVCVCMCTLYTSKLFVNLISLVTSPSSPIHRDTYLGKFIAFYAYTLIAFTPISCFTAVHEYFTSDQILVWTPKAHNIAYTLYIVVIMFAINKCPITSPSNAVSFVIFMTF